jgi:integrase
MRHEVSEGFLRKIGRKWYMILSVDGRREQRKTGTTDQDKAMAMLENWKADLVRGIEASSDLKYGDIRRAYLAEKHPDRRAAIRDLDEFFGRVNVNTAEYTRADPKDVKVAGMRLSNIDRDAMIQFRTMRESKPEVASYEQEQIEKEFALRERKALVASGGKELPKKEIARLKDEAIRWVRNGTKATTNARLVLLRAMFYHAAEKTELIKAGDIPAQFPLWPMEGKGGVDNKKKGFLTPEQFDVLVKRLPKDLRDLVTFLYTTGMRSGAARGITWEMIDHNGETLTIPGELMKNDEALTLPLVKRDGTPRFKFLTKELKRKSTGLVFTATEARLRNEWRKVCHELGHGVFDKRTRSYRGLSLHDFRRSAIRNLRKKGVAEKVIMSISSHKTNYTFKRYDIIDESDKIAALDAID